MSIDRRCIDDRSQTQGEEHLIDKIILSVVLGTVGFNGLFPDPPQAPAPLTGWQLQLKAKAASKSAVCAKKKQSKTVKDLCKRWEKQQNA